MSLEEDLIKRFEHLTEKKKPHELHNPLGVPLEIEYFCKVHNEMEVAVYTGYQEAFGKSKPFALYNTPHHNTFVYETIMEIKEDKKTDDWWNSYRGQKCAKKDLS